MAAQVEWGGEIVGGSLLPLETLFGGLIDDGKLSCSVAGSWRPVIAEPRQQQKAVKEIGSQRSAGLLSHDLGCREAAAWRGAGVSETDVRQLHLCQMRGS
jgi:hypothetical protein